MSLDDYRRGQNAEIERLVKEASNLIASVKSVSEFSEKLYGESDLYNRLVDFASVGDYQIVLKARALDGLRAKEGELRLNENEERKSREPKIGQD